MKATPLLCACGKRRPRFLTKCRACDQIDRAARFAVAQAIVDKNKCPDCGAGLRRNSSMRGWWQCEQFGADTHRKDASKPSCAFQTFTE